MLTRSWAWTRTASAYTDGGCGPHFSPRCSPHESGTKLRTLQNYRKNAAVIARMFRGQIAATICFGFAVIMLAIRVIGE